VEGDATYEGLCLVALQMADEMPGYILWQLGNLLENLLGHAPQFRGNVLVLQDSLEGTATNGF
jgi:hypothetical protein